MKSRSGDPQRVEESPEASPVSGCEQLSGHGEAIGMEAWWRIKSVEGIQTLVLDPLG